MLQFKLKLTLPNPHFTLENFPSGKFSRGGIAVLQFMLKLTLPNPHFTLENFPSGKFSRGGIAVLQFMLKLTPSSIIANAVVFRNMPGEKHPLN